MSIPSAITSNRLRAAVLEHNSLNGFMFVTVEFIMVMLAALFIAWSGLIHGNIILTVSGVGVAVNALTICLMAMHQRSNNEHDGKLMRFWSSPYRRQIESEHKGLGRRTLAIVITLIIPFLLTVLVARK